MPALDTEMTTDFSRGMVEDVAGTRFPKDALAEIINGRIQDDGTVQRRSGSKRTHATALNSGDIGYGGTRFTSAAGTEQLIVIVGDTAYKSEDDGASWTSIATTLREDYYDFAAMRVGSDIFLFAANGDTTIKSWDGTNWSTVSNAPSGVKYIETFNGRLWATGYDGVKVAASKIADPDTWSTSSGALLIQILDHDGGGLTGLHQVGPHLLVFDQDATSYIDGFGEATLIVGTGATGFSRSVGCVGFRSIAAIGDAGCAWLSKRGVEFYTSGGGIKLLSRPVSRFLDNTARQTLKDTPGLFTACYDPVEEEYILALSTTGTRNNRVLVINMGQHSDEHLGACSIDRYTDPDADLLFTAGANGYLTTGAGGREAKQDAEGYWTLADLDEGGDATTSDANGYLDTDTNDAVPATFFIAPTSTQPTRVFSVGFDGFVRLHHDEDLDDVESDDTGGGAFAMTAVSRPFFLGTPRHRKRCRAIHVAAIAAAESTVDVALRTGGTLGTAKEITIPSTALDQAKRKRAMIHAIGDQPQIELTTEDDVRITLLGLSAEIMKERVT